MLYIWQTFLKISNARGAGFSGPLPISYSEIKAWQELSGVELEPTDIEVIKKLDGLFLKVMNG